MSITLGTCATLSSSFNKALLIYKVVPTSNNITIVKPNLYKSNYNKLNN